MVVYSLYAPGRLPRRLESRWCEINRHEMDPPLCGLAVMSHNTFKTSEPMAPREASPMEKKLLVFGIDIAKQVFHLVGMDEHG